MPDDTPSEPSTSSRRSWWPRVRRMSMWVLMLAVAILLVSHARKVDWPAVFTALRALEPRHLAMAGGMALLSYLLYSCFDLLGRRQLRLTLPRSQVMTVAAVSYAFNLNLGALIGGFAFRYRLYSRLGLSAAQVTQVLGLSMLSNWLGYLVLAGVCFSTGLVRVPTWWRVDQQALLVLGVVLLVLAGSYLLACATMRRRTWTIRGQRVTLPSLGVALQQMALSLSNWLMIAAIIHALLPPTVDYPLVLGALMVSAVAGVISHIPAGLGVIEAVFIALLGGEVAHGTLLASLLAYRAVYYLFPLALALGAYVRLEAVTRAPA